MCQPCESDQNSTCASYQPTNPAAREAYEKYLAVLAELVEIHTEPGPQEEWDGSLEWYPIDPPGGES